MAAIHIKTHLKVKMIKAKVIYPLIKDKDLRPEREALLNDKEDYKF
jgi:hypothetical protein